MQLASYQDTQKPFQCHLSHLSLIKVSGADALSFLQGQLSIDLTKLEENKGHLACYLNRKGRMVASLVVTRHAQDYYLEVDSSLKDNLMKTLSMYGAFSKVTIDDVSMIYKAHAFCLQEAPTTDALFTRSLPFGVSAWFKKDMSIESHTRPMLESQAWMTKLIEHGIAHINKHNVEAFTPFDAHFHKHAAISVDKGCYLGQEIVARIHFKGTIKARLFCIKTDSDLKSLDKLQFENTNATVINTVKLSDTHLALITCNQDIQSFSSCMFKEKNILLSTIQEMT